MATGYIMVDTPNLVLAQGGYPRRGGWNLTGTCIVHTSEGDWRRGVQALTDLLRTRNTHGSYHRGCDWQDIALYYPWLWEAWQDSETNNWAVGIAAACKTTDWGRMPADIEEGFYRNMAKMGADFVKYMRDNFGITVPLKRISGADARAGRPGFCAHGDSGIARSDPGANFNWDRFFKYMAEELTQEDELSAEDVRVITAAIDHAFDRSTDELKDAIRSAGKVRYRDPVTGEETEQDTSVNTMAAYSDFQHEATRRLLREVLSAVQEKSVMQVRLDQGDLGILAEELKKVLSPALAADLARRLAE